MTPEPNPYPPGDRRMSDGEIKALVAHLTTVAEDVREDLAEHRRETREQLAAVLVEARATNGRVRALETWQATTTAVRQAFRWWVPVASSVVSGVAVGVVLYILIGGAT